ncbi:hypothetical protein AB6A40_003971 [Gnathostoma spinigerum]|uniref:BED-type domain-containing protein n=1 Tax=Gnathostoma spinigerum TaxID=75299 RepID=A0ABD6EDB8_9BILA
MKENKKNRFDQIFTNILDIRQTVNGSESNIIRHRLRVTHENGHCLTAVQYFDDCFLRYLPFGGVFDEIFEFSANMPKKRTSKGSLVIQRGGRKSRGRANILLWSNFRRFDENTIECVHCEKILQTKDSSTTPLHSHLMRKHKDQYADYLKKKNEGGIKNVRVNQNLHSEVMKQENVFIADNENNLEMTAFKRTSAIGDIESFVTAIMPTVLNETPRTSGKVKDHFRRSAEAEGEKLQDQLLETRRRVKKSSQGNPANPAIIKKSRGPKNLLLWNNFKRTDGKTVECIHCNRVLRTKDSSTTPMHHHMMRKHNDLYANYLKKKREKDVQCLQDKQVSNNAVNEPENGILNENGADQEISFQTASEVGGIDSFFTAVVPSVWSNVTENPSNVEYSFKKLGCNKSADKMPQDKRSKGLRAAAKRPSERYSRTLRSVKRPRRPINTLLWDNFRRLNEHVVECVHCAKILRRKDSSTTSMHNHMMRRHKGLYADYIKRKDRKNVEYLPEENSQHLTTTRREDVDWRIVKETDLTETLVGVASVTEGSETSFSCNNNTMRYPTRSHIQLERDMALMAFLATTSQPYTLVDSPGFKRFVAALDPKMTVKSSTTFSRRKCPLLYENVKAAVHEVFHKELPTCGGVSFTTTTWMSCADEPYKSLNVHYINDEFELKKYTAECRSFLDRRGRESVASILNVMINAIPGLEKGTTKYGIGDCELDILAGHSGKPRCEVGEIGKLFEQCKKLATLSHRSLIRQRIERACRESNISGEIVQPMTSHWTSIYYCLKSIIALKQALLDIKLEDERSDLASTIPTADQFGILEEIMAPLSEIVIASESLSSHQFPTMHMVMLHLATLSNIHKKYVDGGRAVRNFVADFQKYLVSKVPDYGKRVFEYCVGNFLHPKYKGQMMRLGKDNITYQQVLDKLVSDHLSWAKSRRKLEEKVNKVSDKVNRDPTRLRSAWELELELLVQTEMDAEGQSQVPEKNIKSDVELEIYRYVHECPAEELTTVDVLSWWKNHKVEFPLLSHVARKILCIPVSSSSPERLFSTSGNVIVPQRSCLDPYNLEKLVFIQQNYDKVQIKKWNPTYNDQLELDQISSDQKFLRTNHESNESLTCALQKEYKMETFHEKIGEHEEDTSLI